MKNKPNYLFAIISLVLALGIIFFYESCEQCDACDPLGGVIRLEKERKKSLSIEFNTLIEGLLNGNLLVDFQNRRKKTVIIVDSLTKVTNSVNILRSIDCEIDKVECKAGEQLTRIDSNKIDRLKILRAEVKELLNPEEVPTPIANHDPLPAPIPNPSEEEFLMKDISDVIVYGENWQPLKNATVRTQYGDTFITDGFGYGSGKVKYHTGDNKLLVSFGKGTIKEQTNISLE